MPFARRPGPQRQSCVGQFCLMTLRALFIAILLGVNALAGEYAVFASGSGMPIDRHEVEGDTVRLFVNGGSMEIPAGQLVRVDRGESPAPAPAASAAPAPKPEPSARDLVDNAARRYGLPPA